MPVANGKRKYWRLSDLADFTDAMLIQSWSKSSSKTLKSSRITLYPCKNHSIHSCQSQVKKETHSCGDSTFSYRMNIQLVVDKDFKMLKKELLRKKLLNL